MQENLLIKGGRVISPPAVFDKYRCSPYQWVSGSYKKNIASGAEQTIDHHGLPGVTGLVDLALRLREPGHEHEG
jgi:dihydroorotase